MNLPPPFALQSLQPPLPPPLSPFTSLPPPPPPHPSGATTAAPDLLTALSTLSSLHRLTETTVDSLSPLLPAPPPSALIPCPFNSNHRLPHSSLFSHFLSCPSSPTPMDPQPLLCSLHYPHTLNSSSTNSFNQPFQNPTSSELCFSLENFLNFPQNFFYSNCPGAVVVNSSSCNVFQSSSSPPMLTLPGVLSVECANFTRNNTCLDEKGLNSESIRLLPSEIWAVRNEVEGWLDCPSSYSCRVLRVILRLCKSNLLGLSTCVIVNSPKFGIVIDLPMRDHIVLLFKLCLKAVIREAIGFWDLLFNGEGENEEFGLDKKMFDCPVLVNTIMWLGSQLSVLYGEMGGKFFAINMLKQCVLDSALSSSFFPLVEKAKESTELKEPDGQIVTSGENEIKSVVDGSVESSMIFVSQVAAAAAAVYERAWLEEKIKSIRDTRPPTAYQRVVEHEYISKKAFEERQKRSDYRSIIEHDGILWLRAQNQETNRIKTREELLAEERDYKRRRMSYRGKKMKRSTTQVMRDIIDEFMNEIKQAGAHGSAEGGEKAEESAFRSSLRNSSSDILEPGKNDRELELSRAEQHFYGAVLHSHAGHRSTHSEDKYLDNYKQHKRNSRRHHEDLYDDRSTDPRRDKNNYSRSPDDDRSTKRARHDKSNYSRSPDQGRSGYHFHGYARSHGRRDDPEIHGAVICRSSDGSLSKSDERKCQQRQEDGHNWERRNSHTRKKRKDIKSDSFCMEFEDRARQSSMQVFFLFGFSMTCSMMSDSDRWLCFGSWMTRCRFCYDLYTRV